MKIKRYTLAITAIGIGVAALAIAGVQAAECDTNGGAYVRSVIWFTCVGGSQ